MKEEEESERAAGRVHESMHCSLHTRSEEQVALRLFDHATRIGDEPATRLHPRRNDIFP